MRLDHLLSREKAEPEGEAGPEVDAVLSRKGRLLGKHKTVALLTVSFSGVVAALPRGGGAGQGRKPVTLKAGMAGAHLDNRTTEDERACPEGQGNPVMGLRE